MGLVRHLSFWFRHLKFGNFPCWEIFDRFKFFWKNFWENRKIGRTFVYCLWSLEIISDGKIKIWKILARKTWRNFFIITSLIFYVFWKNFPDNFHPGTLSLELENWNSNLGKWDLFFENGSGNCIIVFNWEIPSFLIRNAVWKLMIRRILKWILLL